MDLTPVDIVGKRCYQFIHAEDVEGIRQSHLDCEYCYHLTARSTLIGQLEQPHVLTLFTQPVEEETRTRRHTQ